MLSNEDYDAIFVKNGTGEKVLGELSALYYDRPSYTKGDHFETAYKEGQRSVVEFILRKLTFIQMEQE
jgi:hypothetical protein